jgi:uncharacterized protein involved in outer membrane biogenesis
MSKGKVFGIVALVLVAIVALMTWRVVANLDAIVAGLIEDSGSEVLKTQVSVNGVSIDLAESKAAIGGLTVANPQGFSRGNVFDLNGISIDIQLSSLNKDVIVIETIRISELTIAIETNERGQSNLDALNENIETGAGEHEHVTGDSKPLKLIIDRLEFSGGTATVTAAGVDEDTRIKIPSFRMSGIGRPSGATADTIASTIAAELVNETISAAAQAAINKAIEKKAERLKDKLFGRD